MKEAEETNKLVFISIGYSSRHWCHVMAEKTFEDEEVAKVMNENLINLKVNREEEPDVNQVNIAVVQLIVTVAAIKWNSLLLNNAFLFYEIAVVGEDAEVLLRELQAKNIPNVLLVGSTVKSKLPLFEGRFSKEDTSIYVCQNTTRCYSG